VTLAQRYAERGELGRADAGTNTYHQSAAAKVIHPCDLLCELQRVMEGNDRDPVPYLDALRPRRNRGRIDGGRTHEPERRQVVLGNPDTAVTLGLRQVNFPERLLDHVSVGEPFRLGQELKDTYVHFAAYSFAALQRIVYLGT
jgi:hypothetical protein